jgi:YD repeat-containing protein
MAGDRLMDYYDDWSMIEADDDGVTINYTYDPSGQLTCIDHHGTTDNPVVVYDADGMPVSRAEADTTVHCIGDV